MVLEDWRDNHVIPWGQRADNKLQKLENDQAGHGKRIKDLEGKMGKVEKECRGNSQGLSELKKDTSKIMKKIDRLAEISSQKCGGLGGCEYANGQNAYQ
jgi:peptidoglycan hydrolase CwlO-like protein